MFYTLYIYIQIITNEGTKNVQNQATAQDVLSEANFNL